MKYRIVLKGRHMKSIVVLFLGILCSIQLKAAHITGGEMIYEYLGPGANIGISNYRITLKLFRDDNCTGCATMPASVRIAVFNLSNGSQVFSQLIQKSSAGIVGVTQPPPCMKNPPVLNYSVAFYSFEIELTDNVAGYTAAYNTCCRINSLANVFTVGGGGGQGEGSTYVAQISGRLSAAGSLINSSPQFSTQLIPVCFNNQFTFDFSAIDPDGDSLVYFFCDAYNRGTSTDAGDYTPNPPPYASVQYINGYSGSSPLGTRATINSRTGIISGIAPPSGYYVVSVCIDEYRNRGLIGRHRKDFILPVSNCDIPNADLDPTYITCDGFDFTFKNNTPSATIETYYWDFGDGSTSTDEIPTHVYADTGVYTIKLVVNRNLACSDSAVAKLKVYPGFFPAFQAIGQCKNSPIQFKDLTTSTYGFPNSWRWSFDDPSSGANDSSRLKNPVHTYTTARTYNVAFTVQSNLGCSATITKPVPITDFPAFTVAPKDTLICIVDTVRLTASGIGTAQWSPNYNIDDVNSLTPIVSPDVTTTYRVKFTDPFGCFGFDSLRVRVVIDVTQGSNYDSTMCLGDSARISLTSNALYYTWTPNNGTLNSTTIKNPLAFPTIVTTYRVRGRISNICFAENEITLRPVAPPNVAARDTAVCFGRNTQLFASGGSAYTWTPPTYLSAANVPDPLVIAPQVSTVYTVRVTDTFGCSKPIFKTVRLNVIKVNAQINSSDTAVVIGQPLQLSATGGVFYEWLPDNRWLTTTTIPNPIANPLENIKYNVLVTDSNGCEGRASINVRLYRVVQGLYVPNAFTPNGDGNNDLFRPIPLGITVITRFSVYNRLGELVYTASGGEAARGWDGTFKGKPQDGGNFVWYAEATDYLNKQIKRKGNVVLIR